MSLLGLFAEWRGSPFSASFYSLIHSFVYSRNVYRVPAARLAQTRHSGYRNDTGHGFCLVEVAFSGQDMDVAGLVCEGSPLGVCGVQLPASPGGTELRAAFPGKMFMFQNFPSWLLPLLNGLMSHCLQVLLAVYLDAGSSQSIGEHRYIKRVILSFYPFYKHIL